MESKIDALLEQAEREQEDIASNKESTGQKEGGADEKTDGDESK